MPVRRLERLLPPAVWDHDERVDRLEPCWCSQAGNYERI
jgi:hypothetical protein